MARTKGSGNRSRFCAAEVMETHNFEPLTELILAAKKLKDIANQADDSVGKAIALDKFVSSCKEIVKYKYPQLKATEHSGSIDAGVRIIASKIDELI